MENNNSNNAETKKANSNLIHTIDNEMSPRFGHTLTLVCKTKGDSKAVLFGGATGADGHFSINSDTYIYYIESKKWIKLNRNIFNLYNIIYFS